MKKLFVFAAPLLALMIGASAPVRAADAEITVTEKMFGCMHEGTKIRKTYIRHADPAKLKEAVRIYEGKVEGGEYPVGTVIQMVPNEAMVKHAKAAFPNSNGWEFLAFKVAAEGTTFAGRGDTASNPLGTCLSCHKGAVKYDYICDKGQGCAAIPVTDEQIIGMQSKDPRCPAKP
jgi:hypothetical protein